jgi:hypothetical protein
LIQINARAPERAAMKKASGFYLGKVSGRNRIWNRKKSQFLAKKSRVDYFGLHIEIQPIGEITFRTETAMTGINPYDFGLEKNSANYVPLSPLSFIKRAALVYPNRVALIHGDWQITWKQCYERCLRLACALKYRGADGAECASHVRGPLCGADARCGVEYTESAP